MKNIAIILSLFCLTLNSAIAQSDPETAIKHAEGLSAAFENAANAINGSVVNINSVKHAKVAPRQRMGRAPGRRAPQSPFQNPQSPFSNPYEDFFGNDFFERFFRQQNPKDQAQQGLGTGVILDTEGHIITNNHVVEDADEITVRLSDKKEYKASLVGSDPKTDLAVIKIQAPGLKAAKFGDSEKLKIGEWVVAAGNPFGLDNTITAGIVSAKGRSNVGIVDYEDFIQTDAAINPGNSGGPLINLRGEVVGINSAIFSKSGGYMGIGFSIPSNMVKSVFSNIINSGRVIRGWLGVLIQNLDEDMSRSFGYSGTKGALVGDVTPEGPASRGGIRQGDIITSYNNTPIEDVTHLRNLVAETVPGSSAKLEVFRNGRTEQVSLKIDEQKSETSPVAEPETETDLGLSLRDLTPDIAQQLNTKAQYGAVVTDVEPGGPASRAGVQQGDVIIGFNSEKVQNSRDFEKMLNKIGENSGFRLTIQSGENQKYTFIKRQ
jgi:serine protease Do